MKLNYTEIFTVISQCHTSPSPCMGTHSRQTLETTAPCKRKSSANSTDGGDIQNENSCTSSQVLAASPTLAFVANSSLQWLLKIQP